MTRAGRNALQTPLAARAAVFFSVRTPSRTWMAISSPTSNKTKDRGPLPTVRAASRKSWVLRHPESGQATPGTRLGGAGADENEAQHCATSFRGVHAWGVTWGR